MHVWKFFRAAVLYACRFSRNNGKSDFVLCRESFELNRKKKETPKSPGNEGKSLFITLPLAKRRRSVIYRLEEHCKESIDRCFRFCLIYCVALMEKVINEETSHETEFTAAQSFESCHFLSLAGSLGFREIQ